MQFAIVTVAHYDKTLLAYYLARAEGRPIDWSNVDHAGAKRIEALVMVHALDAGSEAAARSSWLKGRVALSRSPLGGLRAVLKVPV